MKAVTRRTPLDSLPEYLRADEVAALLDISTGTVYEMMRRGDLPHVRFGRLLRVSRLTLAAMAGRNGSDGHA